MNKYVKEGLIVVALSATGFGVSRVHESVRDATLAVREVADEQPTANQQLRQDGVRTLGSAAVLGNSSDQPSHPEDIYVDIGASAAGALVGLAGVIRMRQVEKGQAVTPVPVNPSE